MSTTRHGGEVASGVLLHTKFLPMVTEDPPRKEAREHFANSYSTSLLRQPVRSTTCGARASPGTRGWRQLKPGPDVARAVAVRRNNSLPKRANGLSSAIRGPPDAGQQNLNHRPYGDATRHGEGRLSIVQSYRMRLRRKHCQGPSCARACRCARVADRTAQIAPGTSCSSRPSGTKMCACPISSIITGHGRDHFLIVDNDSSDGSGDYLADQPDVSLWHTSAATRRRALAWTG